MECGIPFSRPMHRRGNARVASILLYASRATIGPSRIHLKRPAHTSDLRQGVPLLKETTPSTCSSTTGNCLPDGLSISRAWTLSQGLLDQKNRFLAFTMKVGFFLPHVSFLYAILRIFLNKVFA